MNKTAPFAKTTRVQHAPPHPRPVPIVVPESADDRTPEQAFSDVCNALDPELRYRLVSEEAYRRYAARGYDDGGDVGDWLEAEAEVDRTLLEPNAP